MLRFGLPDLRNPADRQHQPEGCDGRVHFFLLFGEEAFAPVLLPSPKYDSLNELTERGAAHLVGGP